MKFYSIYLGDGQYLDLYDRYSTVFGVSTRALTPDGGYARQLLRDMKNHNNRYNPDSNRRNCKLVTWNLTKEEEEG
jgi:hypothetical protein